MSVERGKPQRKTKIILGVLAALLGFFIVFWGTLFLLVMSGKRETGPENGSGNETTLPGTWDVTERTEETEKTASSDAETSVPPSEIPRPSYAEEEDRTGYRRIWIGDSRMVGMQRSVAGQSTLDIFIAKGAMYFEWFRDTAVPELLPYLRTGEKLNVIIQMGVNDSANNTKGWTAYTVSDYIALINELAHTYPNARFYFMSVGRTVGNYRGTTIVKPYQVNPQVNEFNARMQNDCYAIYLATGEYVYRNKLGYSDGVHYSTATNRLLYTYVLERLNLTKSEYFEPFPDDPITKDPEPAPTEKETDKATETETEKPEPETANEPETADKPDETAGDAPEETENEANAP